MRFLVNGVWNAAFCGLCALALSGCGGRGEPEAKPKAAAAAANSVKTTEVQKKFLTIQAVGNSQSADKLAMPGRIAFRPQAQSSVGATVAGRVVALYVRAGQAVKAGTPILAIESADASSTRASLEVAATRLASAESFLKRNVEMVEKGVGLEHERLEAEARVKEARTEYERARQSAGFIGTGKGGRVTVTAPTTGVVISIRVSVGATVAPGGEPLLELGDPAQLQVVAQVAESDLNRIAVGQAAEVELPGLNTRVAAKVEAISPRVEAESRRMQVYLTLARRIEGLQAGMLAQVVLSTGTDSAISLPVAAVLVKDAKRRVVYVEKADGTFEARDVETGRNREGHVVILKGLDSGEKVVVKGALLLDTQADLLL